MASDLHAKVYDVLAAYTGLSDTRNEHIAGRVAAALEADLSDAEAAAAREAVEDCARALDKEGARLDKLAEQRIEEERAENAPRDASDRTAAAMTCAAKTKDCAKIVRALPPHPSGALDRMIAEAEKRGYKEGWNDREGDLLNGIDRVYGAEASRDE